MKAEQATAIRLDGHTVKTTRPEKLLFPDDGITKGDLVRYYERIGPWMLPFLKDRPLSLQRYPDGILQPAFFQKSVSAYYPGWIKKATVQKAGGTITHAVCNDGATLVYLANQACITLHVWLSRYAKPHHPDQMIFDLDPPGKVSEAVDAAFALQKILDDLKLPAFVKSTGSRGLHVTVPLQPKEDFDVVRAFARQIGDMLVRQDPARYTMEQYKNKRGARVFIDTNRNAYAQTAVATYSVRARAGAPVSVPLEWDELNARNFRADGVTIQTVFDRLNRIRDPWKDFWWRATSLDKARRKLA